MKKIALVLCFLLIFTTSNAAIPTEEGLLRNVNNPNPAGKVVTIKMVIKNEYYKIVFLLDKPNSISMAQATYGDSQMQSAQLRDIKYIQDLPASLAKETNPEKSLFYGTLLMLATNQSIGMEIFLAKNGVKIPKNKHMMNEEKMELLKSYRTYLLNNKRKGDIDSPLNPTNPAEKAKAIALFKSNSYDSSKNIELIKIGSQFLWKANWKNLQGFFTNEERRLKRFEYKNQDNDFSLETSEYNSFNGHNELPKFIEMTNDKGLAVKIQILNEEVSSKRDLEDFKKKNMPKKDSKEILSFLF